MLDWGSCKAVERDPAKLSGAWVFRGTRVPVSALFENLANGASVEQFLQWFPGVTRAQTDAVLEHAARSVDSAVEDAWTTEVERRNAQIESGSISPIPGPEALARLKSRFR